MLDRCDNHYTIDTLVTCKVRKRKDIVSMLNNILSKVDYWNNTTSCAINDYLSVHNITFYSLPSRFQEFVPKKVRFSSVTSKNNVDSATTTVAVSK